MSKGVVIFGAGQTAEVVATTFAIREAGALSWHQQVGAPRAFVVDRQFVKVPELLGLPVVPFDGVQERFLPKFYNGFVAITFTGLNRHRADAMTRMRALGYKLTSISADSAFVSGRVEIGENVLIGEGNIVQHGVSIGEGTFLWGGNWVGHHTKIGNHVFVASHVVISGACEIGDNTFIGVNATVADGVKIGKDCIIGAGSLVLKDCPDETVMGEVETERSKVPSSRMRGVWAHA